MKPICVSFPPWEIKIFRRISDIIFMAQKFFLKVGVLSAFLIFSAGCATVPRYPGEQQSLKDICERDNIMWSWDNVSQVVTLGRGGMTAKGLVGSSIIVIGQDRITLSGPLMRKGGRIVVPADFGPKVIDRLVQRPVGMRARPCRILLDPGHGGKDPGAISRSGTQEKGIVLDIAQRVKRKLAAQGYDVRMTRNSDQFISLEERTEMASKFAADIFVSIHANANPSRSIVGVEVYSLRDMTTREAKEEQRLRNHRILWNNLAMDKNNADLQRTLADMLYSYKKCESGILSSYVTKGLSSHIRAVDRGARQSGYFVLRNTLVPAILIEVGYLTNAGEEKLLKTSNYREKIADGVADSITRYLNR